MNEDLAPKWPKQRKKRAPDIAASNEGKRAPMKQDRVAVVTLTVKCLGAGTDCGISFVNSPRGTDRKADCHLRNRFCEDRSGRQNRNVSAMAFCIVDIRQKIAFNVEDSFQLRRSVQALPGETALADQKCRRRQIMIYVFIRRR